MSNHLIIGLGGTGGKIIRAFRKIIFQEFRETTPQNIQIGYLYVDSDKSMMAPDDLTWKILGHQVQLGRNSQLCIEGADLQNRLDNVVNFPGMKEWIGDPQQWSDILRSFAGGTVLGGQKRRLGRFLFSCNIERFSEQLRQQVEQLHRASNRADITFHVICGLAGGTGSGAVVDVLSQIRKYYPYGDTNANNRVLAYAFLPERQPKPQWDTGNYHANGYAALVELNALSAGGFAPHDIAQGGRRSCNTPFNGLYLFTNQNEQGVIVDVDTEIPHIMADFLFQKIVAVRNIAWDSLRRLENMENGDSTPETSPVEGSKTPERAKRFLTFGIKRVAIPEEEIKEYLSYHFALQVALHLKFNNWEDSRGFVNHIENQDYLQLLSQKNQQSNWPISLDHLTLSRAILPADRELQWKAIDDDWDIVVAPFKNLVREMDKTVWLDELGELFEERFQQKFRSRNPNEPGGVQRFYELKMRSRSQMAKEIRLQIENDLFDEWKNGTRSLNEIGELITTLVTSLDERRRELDDRSARSQSEERQIRQAVDVTRLEWARAGMVKRMMRANQLLDQQGLHLRNLYTTMTWIEGLGFAKRLLDELLVEMRQFQAELDRATNAISKAVEDFENQLAQRIKDDRQDLSRQLVRFYDRVLVETVTQSLISNEQLQKTCASEVRNAIIRRIGAEPDFSKFNQLGFSAINDILVRASEQNALREHDRQNQHTQQRLLGVNIIEKLRERYEGDQDGLRLYIHELVNHACNFLHFNNSEIQKVGPGIPLAPTRSSQFTVVLPSSPQHPEFVEQLKNAFIASYPGQVEFLDSDTKPNEIAIVNLTNLFPLRFVDQVSFLQQKYEARLQRPDADRAKIEIHIEGDGHQFPSLFVPSMEDVRTEAVPYLLLAKSMKLITEVENPATGVKQFAFLQKDQVGFDLEPVYLGEKFEEAFEKVNTVDLDQIKRKVQELLTSNYLHRDSREQIKATILEEVERIKQARNDNIEDPIFRRFNQGGRRAVELL